MDEKGMSGKAKRLINRFGVLNACSCNLCAASRDVRFLSPHWKVCIPTDPIALGQVIVVPIRHERFKGRLSLTERDSIQRAIAILTTHFKTHFPHMEHVKVLEKKGEHIHWEVMPILPAMEDTHSHKYHDDLYDYLEKKTGHIDY